MHACRLAEELQMTRVLFPRAGGVLSALGLAVSDLRRDYLAPLLGALGQLRPQQLDAAFETLENRARADLPTPTLERFADARYKGQSFELTVPATNLDAIASTFHDAHERRYSYRLDGTPIELVAVRVAASSPVAKPALVGPAPTVAQRDSSRPAYFDGGWIDTAVIGVDALANGDVIFGPAIVEFAEATCVIRPGWIATVDPTGALLIDRR
jgi:N-methylhydantoinase A